MNYWRMQLHPADPKWAMSYATQSIEAGFIGLDFDKTEDGDVVGDLLSNDNQQIQPRQTKYVDFAKTMAIGDKVLIMVHHCPLAVVTVEGEYNYIRRTEPELGVWFRHFRKIIKDPIYFSDFVTGNRQWSRSTSINMRGTIEKLNLSNTDSESYRLMQDMIAWYASNS